MECTSKRDLQACNRPRCASPRPSSHLQGQGTSPSLWECSNRRLPAASSLGALPRGRKLPCPRKCHLSRATHWVQAPRAPVPKGHTSSSHGLALATITTIAPQLDLPFPCCSQFSQGLFPRLLPSKPPVCKASSFKEKTPMTLTRVTGRELSELVPLGCLRIFFSNLTVNGQSYVLGLLISFNPHGTQRDGL